MTGDTRALATTYLQSWQDKDFTTMRSTIADDVTFRGTLGAADGIEECMKGVQGLAAIMTGITIHQMVVEGADVMTWYDLETSVAPPCATVNWSHVESGKITAIRAVFDPRALVNAT
ncbi:MAG: nuclear transport factor 2 family protein [Nocardioidaceae bacterium]